MLITLEGIDGSGKTTLWEALREHARIADFDPHFTREPTTGWTSDAVYDAIQREDTNPLTELHYYLGDHATHVDDIIRPRLDNDELIISDRYIHSRIAYQSQTLEDHPEIDDPVQYIQDSHEPWTRYPDLVIYINVPPQIGAERSGRTNKFEHAPYLESVHEAYHEILNEADMPVMKIDGTQSKAFVQEAAVDIIEGAASGELQG